MGHLKFINFKVLDLGNEYLLNFYRINKKTAIRVKLVKVTRKGYNFLNIDTNKCVLKTHMYINKNNKIVLPKAILVSKLEFSLDKERLINLF